MNKKLRNFFLIATILSATSIVIIFILAFDYTIVEKINKINILLLGAAFALHFLSLLFWSLRIKIMVKILKENISLGKSMKIVLVNVFVAAITPSQIGGEPIRIKMLLEEGLSSGGATGLVVTERILDFIFLIVVAPITLILAGTLIELDEIALVVHIATLLMVIAVLFMILLILFERRIASFLCKIVTKLLKRRQKNICEIITREAKNFSETAKKLLKNRNSIRLFFITALIWLADLVIPSIILLSMNENPYWLYSLAVQFILMISMMLPITPGGSAIAEFGSFILYSKILPKSTVALLTLLWRIVLFYTNLIVGFIFTALYLKRYLLK